MKCAYIKLRSSIYHPRFAIHDKNAWIKVQTGLQTGRTLTFSDDKAGRPQPQSDLSFLNWNWFMWVMLPGISRLLTAWSSTHIWIDILTCRFQNREIWKIMKILQRWRIRQVLDNIKWISTGPRNLSTLKITGTKSKILFRFDPAQLFGRSISFLRS